jgi:2-keto-4-pentenoate hydratase/2-oxohepta-3-ene-1,7-dioic acid hydratase in catechol pathway
VPKEPFFFLKPTTSYVASGGSIEIPRGVDAHHEGKSALHNSGHQANNDDAGLFS